MTNENLKKGHLSDEELVEWLPLACKAGNRQRRFHLSNDEFNSLARMYLVEANYKFDPSRGASWKTFLYNYTNWSFGKQAFQHFRPKRYVPPSQVESDELLRKEASPDPRRDDMFSPLAKERLEVAMSKLLPKERYVIERYYFRRDSYRDIADTLGVTRQAIQQKVPMILKKLRRTLAPIQLEEE